MPKIRNLSIALACVLASPAMAQDEVAGDPAVGGDRITLGAGGAIAPDYVGSGDYRLIPYAAARGSIGGFAFSTQGLKLYVDAIPNPTGPGWDLQLGPVVGVNLNRSASVSDARVDALPRRKVALEVGGYAGIGRTGVLTSDYDRISLSVTYVQDVSGIHDSYVITPSFSYGTPLSRTAFVGVSASADYAGAGYANTYFGVSPADSVVSGLPAFDPDGAGWKSWSVSGIANVSLTGDLTGGLSLVGVVAYSKLLNDFADSPIVAIAGDRNQWFGGLGLAYTF